MAKAFSIIPVADIYGWRNICCQHEKTLAFFYFYA